MPAIPTDGELQVLQLLAQGYTNKEIALQLYLSPYTIINHKKSLMAKLKAKNSTHLVYLACQNGMIE